MFKPSSVKKIHYDEVTSTMDVAVKHIQEGETQPILIVAKEQSQGKGRGKNLWFSPTGGLYITLAFPLMERLEKEKLALVHYSTALAVISTLRKLYGIETRVKWPNDVLIRDRKISGILIEYISSSTDYLLIGIGVNVNLRKDDFPKELQDSTTSIYLSKCIDSDLNELTEALKFSVSQFTSKVLNNEIESIIDQFNNRCLQFQKTLLFQGKHEYLCTGITTTGHLKLINQDEEILLSIEQSSDIITVRN
jgi:BirA family biotin operon repressor/biotin-[acetyl-CoA-carboxylase] ligase